VDGSVVVVKRGWKESSFSVGFDDHSNHLL
jgi:hypothetical protein